MDGTELKDGDRFHFPYDAEFHWRHELGNGEYAGTVIKLGTKGGAFFGARVDSGRQIVPCIGDMVRRGERPQEEFMRSRDDNQTHEMMANSEPFTARAQEFPSFVDWLNAKRHAYLRKLANF